MATDDRAVPLPNTVLQSNLSDGAKVCYGLLLSCVLTERTMTQSALADVLKHETRTAQRHLLELEDAGFLTRRPWGRTRAYRLHVVPTHARTELPTLVDDIEPVTPVENPAEPEVGDTSFINDSAIETIESPSVVRARKAAKKLEDAETRGAFEAPTNALPIQNFVRELSRRRDGSQRELHEWGPRDFQKLIVRATKEKWPLSDIPRTAAAKDSKNLQRLIQEYDGHKVVLLIEYVFNNFEALRSKLNITNEIPNVSILYGFRQPFMTLMKQDWKGDEKSWSRGNRYRGKD